MLGCFQLSARYLRLTIHERLSDSLSGLSANLIHGLGRFWMNLMHMLLCLSNCFLFTRSWMHHFRGSCMNQLCIWRFVVNRVHLLICDTSGATTRVRSILRPRNRWRPFYGVFPNMRSRPDWRWPRVRASTIRDRWHSWRTLTCPWRKWHTQDDEPTLMTTALSHECCCFPLFARSNHCAPNQSNQLFSQVAISVPQSPKWSKNPLGCAFGATKWDTPGVSSGLAFFGIVRTTEELKKLMELEEVQLEYAYAQLHQDEG